MMAPEVPAIHVLVVDDSAVVREVLSAVLNRETNIAAEAAADPLIALVKIKLNRPDVILLDLALPRMDGLTFLQKIMREDPIPVVICSALTGSRTGIALRALEEGAVDIVTKPHTGVRQFLQDSAVLLTDAVRAAAHYPVRRVRPWPMASRSTVRKHFPSHEHAAPSVGTVVALGASTGGTEALKIVLEAMPANAPGMAIVQHMPEGFTAAFAERLQRTCRIAVKEAAHGDRIAPGLALIAPGNRHLYLRRRGSEFFVEVVDGPLVSRHRPSVDLLFRSVASCAGDNAVGALLTGMGSDGAEGLLAMKMAGAFTLAQDENSSVVFGMPKEAIARGAAVKVVSLDFMAQEILRAAAEKRHGAATFHRSQFPCNSVLSRSTETL